MRRPIPIAILTCLALLLPAAGASAGSRQFTTVEAPGELLHGSPDGALDVIQGLGATAIRIQLSWASVAPDAGSSHAPAFNATDPSAYPAGSWASYDRAIVAARARGLRVLVTLSGPAPHWATARHDGLTSPSATAFGKFATAAARRYGSQVSWWSIWNEPNLGKLLKPIAGLKSARVYRDLYLKAYAGLRGGGARRTPILIGELAPIGNSYPSIGTISPLRFMRAMLCLDSNWHKSRKCGPVPTSGFAIHPYTTKFGPRFTPSNSDDVSINVLSRLTTALDRAAKAGALPRNLPVYVTEFGVQSYPDHISGVSLAAQSDYRSLSEYMAYRNGRVASFSQYLLRDDQTLEGATGRFESGLFLYKGGAPKPSLISFRLPLVVVTHGGSSHATLWGLVRPAHGHGGSLTVQYRDGRKAWKTQGTQRYGGSGYWTRHVTQRSGRAWRVVWTAPDGVAYTGPATLPH